MSVAHVPTASAVLDRLGLAAVNPGVSTGPGDWTLASAATLHASDDPASGQPLAAVQLATDADYDRAVDAARTAFVTWRSVPAPKRGELVRDLGQALRDAKEPLGDLVTLEMGKIRAEGHGEVQEMIDICDFAVGLSRQLYGLTIASERPGHRMMEQWHPLGPVGVITAFNFPVAVWSWNAALAAVCGDTVVWKPAEPTPLTALAVQRIANQVMADHGVTAVFTLVVGTGRTIGERMLADDRLPLISFTGSTAVGRRVSQVVAERFGQSLLELGGNNAIVIAADADLDMAVRAVLFGAVGTAGQRCTSTRRLIVHTDIVEALAARLVAAYRQVPIGAPLEAGTLMGPLVNDRRGRLDAGGAGPGGERRGSGAVRRRPAARHRPALRRAGDRPDAGAERRGPPRDVCPNPVSARVLALRGGARAAQRRAAGPVVGNLHRERPNRRSLPVGARVRLRHRQRQHRNLGGRDRRRLRRREGDRRRPRVGLRRLEGVHAPPDQHRELVLVTAACARHTVR